MGYAMTLSQEKTQHSASNINKVTGVTKALQIKRPSLFNCFLMSLVIRRRVLRPLAHEVVIGHSSDWFYSSDLILLASFT